VDPWGDGAKIREGPKFGTKGKEKGRSSRPETKEVQKHERNRKKRAKRPGRKKKEISPASNRRLSKGSSPRKRKK